ncbi:uncharacterized protein LOC131156680 isoform X2 [Malania oleifera]|uniref:uncharacterized protein LOC131156680 isoform X2 n=1 Tax=Malania oleifera TaxID=397392 RepID=UPI0025AE4CE7|nr:uncharacterized protein LOC131156680 isoform X2 [Malania oleifera]
MEVIAFPYTTLFRGTATDYSRHCVDLISTNKNPSLIGLRRLSSRVRAITEFPPAVEPTQVSLTWQIVVGAVAGVAPFVVAGIEFSKRIMAQRKCQVCAGSGLVLREKYYIRCPACGNGGTSCDCTKSVNVVDAASIKL